MKITVSAAALAIASLTFVGCAHQATVSQWQTAVRDTIQTDTVADPSLLRAEHLEDGRRIIRVIGQDDPQGATDQVGILMGRTNVADHHWFVFLLGTVKNDHLDSARLAAFTVSKGKLYWQMGAADPAATEHYLAWHASRWALRHPNRATSPESGFGWPAESDDFQFFVKGAGAAVRELNSHAQWSIYLPAEIFRSTGTRK